MLAGIAVAALYWWLPDRLTPGPSWIGAVAILVALAASAITHRSGLHSANRVAGFASLILITGGLAWSLAMLILGLPSKKEAPGELLRAAVALWSSNILVFASWYWRLDAGGPHSRDLRGRHDEGAFLFPQMTLPHGRQAEVWKPGFVD